MNQSPIPRALSTLFSSQSRALLMGGQACILYGDFDELWERREEIDLPAVGRIAVMAIEDLVRAQRTQRDKDWPMIRRLLEADFHRRAWN